MFQVLVPGGFDSIPLSLEDALEYAFEAGYDCKVIDLATGEEVEVDERW